jgi:dihydroxyacetone kinase-like protein
MPNSNAFPRRMRYGDAVTRSASSDICAVSRDEPPGSVQDRISEEGRSVAERAIRGVRKRRTEMVFDGGFFARWLRASADAIADHRDFLTQLDAAIGDADHGINMDRGFAGIVAIIDAADGILPGELLSQAGATLVLRVGGAAGPLYGTAFRDAGRSVADRTWFGVRELADALDAALRAITKLGAADPGDKTIVDAWAPGLDALRRASSSDPIEILRAARLAAEAGAAATIPMEARKGRASYLGPRSVGHQDPGATSTALLFAALEEAAG